MSNQEPVTTKKMFPFTINIFVDDSPENPREWDNFGVMACFHGRYNLGDKHSLSVEELEEIEESIDYISLPLYLYDHSGITMSTTPFYCPWDSGKVGIIYVSVENAVKEFGEIPNKELEHRVIELLKSEVKVYDQYLRGDCYGYIITNDITSKEIDSCWGFYEDDLNDDSYIMREAISTAERKLKESQESID